MSKKQEEILNEEEVIAPVFEKKQKIEKKQKKTVIYIGPTIVGVVTQNSIFNNGIPYELEETMKEIPVVEKLIIPVESLATASQQLNKKQGILYTCYEKVKKVLERSK